MESDRLWEIFQNSGRVADYLAYRQSLMAETACETHPVPDTAEDPQHERRDAHGSP